MIPAPNLDDRTHADIVEEAMRLIPQYCPEWTNHNAADPGITLIELFAWMTEMVVYRLNKVTDKNFLAFLDLMGVDLQPPHPARTLLRFNLSEGSEATLEVVFPVLMDIDGRWMACSVDLAQAFASYWVTGRYRSHGQRRRPCIRCRGRSRCYLGQGAAPHCPGRGGCCHWCIRTPDGGCCSCPGGHGAGHARERGRSCRGYWSFTRRDGGETASCTPSSEKEEERKQEGS